MSINSALLAVCVPFYTGCQRVKFARRYKLASGQIQFAIWTNPISNLDKSKLSSWEICTEILALHLFLCPWQRVLRYNLVPGKLYVRRAR